MSEPTLAELQARVVAFAAARDWGQYHNPRNLAMALSVEAGELLELFLWSSDGGPQPPQPERRARVAEEAADVLMCLLNLAERAQIDLAAALDAKLEAAAVKYPVERVRGRALKYDEYPEWRAGEGDPER
ncbi:MAG TPA: nucleotide pyrophosphohydrolase [Myxococcota bacterium]|nr:nucleotide pyrophosphohydrolase [Myxococcota bacterium]